MDAIVTQTVRWTTSDLELLDRDEWKRYEIVDGELFVTRAPHWGHQKTASNIYLALQTWSLASDLGEANCTPGMIFTDTDSVIPDVIWISQERLKLLLDEQGHLTGAPELVVEVLSSGTVNERRDREAKLKLYSIQGVQEYWIVDWRSPKLELYRRQQSQLKLIATLFADDELTSPLLPNFKTLVSSFLR
jgi:Uma2 family endonuclease